MRDRSLRIVLLVSIVLNLFAIGAIGGGAVMWAHLDTAPRPAGRRPLRTAGDALPPADEARYRALMRDTFRQAEPSRLAAVANRRMAADLFVQPGFDIDAVTTALAQARDADFSLRTRLEGAVVDFARTLPQPERVILAQGLARGGPLRRPRKAPAR